MVGVEDEVLVVVVVVLVVVGIGRIQQHRCQ